MYISFWIKINNIKIFKYINLSIILIYIKNMPKKLNLLKMTLNKNNHKNKQSMLISISLKQLKKENQVKVKNHQENK